ncbi:MAG: type II secretion system protein [Patescibacteria group bacterium]
MIKNQKFDFTPLGSLTMNISKLSHKSEAASPSYKPKSIIVARLLTGFTLVETIVVVAIFGIAMLAVSGFIITIYRAQNFNFEQSIAIDEARKGTEIMVKEIREAGTAENGSYVIEKAEDNEFIFYSDIDNDNSIERVRYFLGPTARRGTIIDDCVAFANGGSCSVSFSNFLTGILESASVKINVEGDLGAGNEYVDVTVDGFQLTSGLCQSFCVDCAGAWEGTTILDVTNYAIDGVAQFVADASSRVNNVCGWEHPNHAMKARFEFSWTETAVGAQTNFNKGVIKPEGWPSQYLEVNEKISVLSYYVRNTTPVFRYFNKDGMEITSLPARPEETTLMRVYLKVNVDPNRAPNYFELESDAQVRNLKTNL